MNPLENRVGKLERLINPALPLLMIWVRDGEPNEKQRIEIDEAEGQGRKVVLISWERVIVKGGYKGAQ